MFPLHQKCFHQLGYGDKTGTLRCVLMSEAGAVASCYYYPLAVSNIPMSLQSTNCFFPQKKSYISRVDCLCLRFFLPVSGCEKKIVLM